MKLESIFNHTENESLEHWKSRILDLIETEKVFLNPNLTLMDMANLLNTNQTLVSKMINQGFRMNFNDFINEFRVKDVIEAFHQGKYKKHTLLGISFDSGFNSKTSFNRSFKKHTGLSPKEYLSKLKETPQEPVGGNG